MMLSPLIFEEARIQETEDRGQNLGLRIDERRKARGARHEAVLRGQRSEVRGQG